MRIFFKWLFLAISLIPTMIYTSLFETNNLKQKQRNFLSFFILLSFSIGKYMVGKNNEYGFLFTVMGSILTAIKYIKFDKRYILGLLEILTIFIFLYLFYIWLENKVEMIKIIIESYLPTKEITITIVLICLIRFLYSLYKKLKPTESLLENLSIICFFGATVLLLEKNIYAWVLFIIAHSCLGLLQLIQKEKDPWFFILQLVLLIISIKTLI